MIPNTFFFLLTLKIRISTTLFKPQFSYLFKQQFLKTMTKRALSSQPLFQSEDLNLYLFQNKTLGLQFWVYWPRVRVMQIFERCLPLLAKVHDFLILTILHAKMTLRV